MTKTEFVVKVVNGKDIIGFDNEDAAVTWALDRKERHGDRVAKAQVVRRVTIIEEEVLINV